VSVTPEPLEADGARGGEDALSLPFSALDRLMPMHVVLRPSGHIAGVGPSLQKLRPGDRLTGRRFLDVFELRRPAGARRVADLAGAEGGRLRLSFREIGRAHV